MQAALDRIAGWLDVPLFRLGEAEVTTEHLLVFTLVFSLSFLLSALLRRGLRRVVMRNDELPAPTAYTLIRLSHYVIITLGFLIALSVVGIDLTNLTIVAGALGIGIGFGLQSIVNNFVSGLILLFEHNVKVGDYVVLASGLSGKVEAINVRSTHVRTLDNLDVIVPNSQMISEEITNWTLNDTVVRYKIPFGVAYGSNKEIVREAALAAAAAVDFTITTPPGRPPALWLVEFGDSSLNFELVVWADLGRNPTPGSVLPRYLWAIHEELLARGVQIPFPQRDVHIIGPHPSG